MINKWIFCGGGSGGHVMPALTLISEIKNKSPQVEIFYIGSYKGIERHLTQAQGLKYKPIFTGKIRRYFSFENLLDLFKVVLGLFQALIFLLSFSKKDTAIFSTGGFVSVPVVIAAWLTGKKVFVHEQTARIGLANKIASRFATTFFISFEDTRQYLPQGKVVYSGYPVRDSFFDSSIGKVQLDATILNSLTRPILFITGGGNGSTLINKLVRDNFDFLTSKFFVLHQVGKQEFQSYQKLRNEFYFPVQFLGEEICDCMKLASVVISRAGAGTVCELMALGKKSIYIPLKIAQKNEQYHNAMEASRLLGSLVIEEDQLASTNWEQILSQDFSSTSLGHLGERAQDIILKHLSSF